uniref:Putative secreted protein n=1 Tax=Ixodes ricinus TaxID=34613 RepID=A0A090X844_IXORI
MSRIHTIEKFPGAWNGEPVKIVSEQRWRRVRPCSSRGAVTKEISSTALLRYSVSRVPLGNTDAWTKPPSAPATGAHLQRDEIEYLKTPVEDALELLVKCPNEKIGCGFVCALGTLSFHLSNSCDFKSTKRSRTDSLF